MSRVLAHVLRNQLSKHLKEQVNLRMGLIPHLLMLVLTEPPDLVPGTGSDGLGPGAGAQMDKRREDKLGNSIITEMLLVPLNAQQLRCC